MPSSPINAVKWIIYTDLDGTLLDFETYSFEQSAETVAQISALHIPLIFCSSKTRVEQEVYRKALRLEAPFIVENGSAILVPEAYFDFDLQNAEVLKGYAIQTWGGYHVILLGQTVDFIRKTIVGARKEAGIDPLGYADLSLEKVMQLTGLDKAAAHRAATRDYSETLLQGTDSGPGWKSFLQILSQRGLQCVSGGKFHTVMGQGSDKGKAVTLLNHLLRKKYGEICSAGLGDSANDLPMLQAVDYPFLVQKPSGNWQKVEDEGIKKIGAIGPAGFNLAIHYLLNN